MEKQEKIEELEERIAPSGPLPFTAPQAIILEAGEGPIFAGGTSDPAPPPELTIITPNGTFPLTPGPPGGDL